MDSTAQNRENPERINTKPEQTEPRSMPRTGLSTEEMRIAALDAAEATIRRHGVERTRITDVARLVGVNHARLYRIFPDKAALLDGVSDRWLRKLEAALTEAAHGEAPVPERLSHWFLTLHRLKREKVAADPELYNAFSFAAAGERPFVARHVTFMREQLRDLIAEGMVAGYFAEGCPQAIADLVFEATYPFHHPQLVLDTLHQDREPALLATLDVLIRGLRRTQ